MATTSRMPEEYLRRWYRDYLNPLMLLMWRLGLGGWFEAWPEVSGRVFVLTHIGRKTGRRRRQPLNYARVNGDIYCVAGFGAASDWCRNIRANPSVEVWLPEGWWSGLAEDVSEVPARAELIRSVLIGSGFAARLAGLNPRAMSDAQIVAACRDYRLFRIRLGAARTGAGGLGDLAWIWPLATMALLAFILLRPRHRKLRRQSRSRTTKPAKPMR